MTPNMGDLEWTINETDAQAHEKGADSSWADARGIPESRRTNQEEDRAETGGEEKDQRNAAWRPREAMNLDKAIEIKKSHTTQASQNVRALAFAGIGIVWILSNQKLDGLRADLLWALILFGIVLVLDFLHYAVASLIWETFVNHVETHPKLRDDVHARKWFNWPTEFLFWSKQAAIIPAYVVLLRSLFARLVSGGHSGV